MKGQQSNERNLGYVGYCRYKDDNAGKATKTKKDKEMKGQGMGRKTEVWKECRTPRI